MIPFTKITMFPYSEQVQDIEHYSASVGGDMDAKQANEIVFMNFGTLNTMVQVLEMILMLKRTLSNKLNGYSMNIDY